MTARIGATAICLAHFNKDKGCKMERPTLEEQIRVSKMTREELIDLFRPHGFWQKVSFWMHWHCESLWHIVRWKWNDMWEGTEDADKYRCWAIKLKRKLFGGNK